MSQYHQTGHIRLGKNSDIEALRALAILLVIAAHISALLSPDSWYRTVLAHFRFGYGVDIFFCISGFIITKSILQEIPESRSFRSIRTLALPFWTRRFWRLMPSALFWVLMGLLLAGWAGGRGYIPSLDKFAWPATAAALQFFNVIFPACRDAGTCGTVGVYWSLSLENQFYLLLPIVAVLAGKRWISLVFGAVFLIQFFLERQLTDPTPALWAFRTDAIALGVLLALWQDHNSYQRLKPDLLANRSLTIIFLIGMIAALGAITTPVAPIPFAMGWTAVGSAVLVWIASYNQNYLARSRIMIALCAYIGSRSYAIYLSHFIVLFGIRHFLFSPAGSQTPTPYDAWSVSLYVGSFVVGTLACSEFNYRYIETPLRRRGESIARTMKARSAQTA
jgi:peptidoglycan/LPS O-acetylase OafA/YrhL